MLRHLLKYGFKTYVRNRPNLIWNIVFPFAYLAIFFMALFSLSDTNSGLDTIHLALVPGHAAVERSEVDGLKTFLAFAGEEGSWQDEEIIFSNNEESLFVFVEGEESEATTWLEEDKIDAMILIDDELSFKVNPIRRIAATVLHEALSSYERMSTTQEVLTAGYAEGKFTPPADVAEVEANRFLGIIKEGRSKAILSEFIFFFAALAYVSFFPISSGTDVIESIEPGQSPQALRKAVAPLSKWTHFFGALIPRWLTHLLLVVLAYGFTQVLGIDYGGDHLRIIALLLLGTSAAIFTGTAIGSLVPTGQGPKVALSISLPLLFAMASGMMASELHTLVMQYVPWLHNINPLGRVTNGLHALYAGTDLSRYIAQLQGLGIYIAVCFALTLLGIRRTRYESV